MQSNLWRSRLVGLWRTIGNRVYRKVSRVRIPPSPPSKGSPLIKIKKQHPLLFYFFFFCFAFAFLANRETKYVTLVVKHGLFEQAPRYSVVLSHSLRIPPSPPLANNTNLDFGFVLFFAVDYFGIIVERN